MDSLQRSIILYQFVGVPLICVEADQGPEQDTFSSWIDQGMSSALFPQSGLLMRFHKLT